MTAQGQKMLLSEYLDRNGITQECFAEQIGVTGNTVSRWVCGDRFPRKNDLIKIYNATRGAVTCHDLFIQHLKDKAQD